MERVITIHGIWTKGRWQERIAPVLWPHFKPISVKYPHYLWLGPLDLVLEPLILFPGLFVLILAAKREWLVVHWPWVAAGFLIVAAHWATRFRQERALEQFLSETAMLPPSALHIVAHSFGTRLLAQALQKHAPMKANRIVLAGCILCEEFDWKALVDSKAGAFQAVRNDVGRKDFPVWVSGCLQWLKSDFGAAGRYGFDLVSGWVHDLQSAEEVCRCCTNLEPPAPIHNVFNEHGRHGTAIRQPDYTAWYWLPFFWKLEPAEYKDFVDLCWGAATAYAYEKRSGLRLRAGEAEKYSSELLGRLLVREWHWAKGTLGQYIKLKIVELHPNLAHDAAALEDEVNQAMFYVCFAIEQAVEARSRKLERVRHSRRKKWVLEDEGDNLILALHPEEAVGSALDKLAAQKAAAP